MQYFLYAPAPGRKTHTKFYAAIQRKHKPKVSQKMNMAQSKLTGTEAFTSEPTINMWTEIQTLGDHELDTFDFDTESLLIHEDEHHEDPIVRIHEDLDCTKKRYQNANARRPAKRRKSTGLFNGMPCDESIISQTDVSAQSAQLPFMTPIELDEQLEHSMSRLALSMKRSEMSRQRVICNESSLNASVFRSLLAGPSSFRSNDNYANARSPHIGSYMSQMGATL